MINQRRKGKAFEQSCAKQARDAGLDAQRTAPLQAAGSDVDADLLLAGYRVECKDRASIPGYIWEWLGTNDMLLIHTFRKETLALIRYDLLLAILGGKSAGQSADGSKSDSGTS